MKKKMILSETTLLRNNKFIKMILSETTTKNQILTKIAINSKIRYPNKSKIRYQKKIVKMKILRNK